jgi:hypothetical protein
VGNGPNNVPVMVEQFYKQSLELHATLHPNATIPPPSLLGLQLG